MGSLKNCTATVGVQVNTYATATTVLGDYERVMDILRDTLAWSHERFGKAVFVARLIPGYDLDK